MEYLQVFDEKKNMLKEKIGREEKYSLPEGKYFMVVLIFIENSKGEFLLQKTSKSRNSCMATTGGHVSYGDNAIETVIKECKEELGLDINRSELSFVDTSMFKNGLLETYYIKMDLDINKLTLQEEEVESVGWYTKEDISRFIKTNEFREGNIEPYAKVLEFINK